MSNLASFYFSSLSLLVVLSFLAMFLCWRPVAQQLGVSFLDQSVSCRVILRGINGGSSLLQRNVRRCRLVFLGIYVAFFGMVFVFLGLEGFLFLSSFFTLSFLLTRPYDVIGDQ
ncbi:MAG: hypothetical protein BM559_03540 [Roseobacter sp. MedPE-SWchi]|nr:MAG: hypothetical protein BM559_03540 [Roseobacter sp. MedPE-SWchi]